MNELRAFHNDPAIKEKYLRRLHYHAAADEIIKGTYWESGKGCAVGCTVHSSDHAAYERELGLPQWLARLEDGIFEALPNGKAKHFPVDFLKSIPVGSDTSAVRDQFLAWLMDSPYGLAVTTKDDEIKNLAIEIAHRLRTQSGVTGEQADGLTARIEGARDAWDARATWDAWAARAARDARDAWGAWAARATWDARDAWGAWGARAARAARDARDARGAFVTASAEELLRLLKGLNWYE